MESIRTAAARPNGRSAAAVPLSAAIPPSARAAARAPDRDGATQPATQEAPDLYALLEQIRAGTAAVGTSRMKLTKAVNKTLADIYGLHRLTKSDPAARRALEREYKKARIRPRKKTTEFTRLVKWLLGEDPPRGTVSRWASTLQLAHEEKVEPEEFVAFVQRTGGTVACAREVARRRKAATADASPLVRVMAARSFEERVRSAPKIKLPVKLAAAGDDGLVMLLVRPVADGSYAVLGQRPAAAGAVRTFARIAAALAAGAARRRR